MSFAKVTSALVLLAVMSCFVILFLPTDKPRAPRSLLLGEIRGPADISFRFTCPRASDFNFVFSISDGATDLRGLALLTNIVNGLSFTWKFTPSSIQPCNWLASRGLQGHIISWPRMGTSIFPEGYFQSGSVYNINIELESAHTGTLWLVY